MSLSINRIHPISVPPVEGIIRIFRNTAVNLAIDASVVHNQMLRLVAIPVSARIIANAHAAKFQLFCIECKV